MSDKGLTAVMAALIILLFVALPMLAA